MQRPSFGGRRIGLYSVEHEVIRPRFGDPRFHFALNCASAGCPKLQRSAFRGDRLEQQLTKAAEDFFADERQFYVDHERKVVLLSPILKWYREDFLGWMRSDRPNDKPTMLNYAEMHARPTQRADIQRARKGDYRIKYTIYDWRLNGK